MSSNTFLIDAATRHQIFVQRFSGSEAMRAKAQLERLRKEIVARIDREPTEFEGNRLSFMLSDIERLMSLAFADMTQKALETVVEFGKVEAEFTVAMANQASTVSFLLPDDAQITQAILRNGMDAPIGPDQITIQQALNQFARKKTQEVTRVINDGILLGETTPQISKKVSELVNTRTKLQSETLTRTIINHASSEARQATLQENDALIKGYEWVSTLDSRTTLICGGRDGRLFPTGRGPLPPAHWGCRSTTIPVMKDEFAVDNVKGRRPAIGDEDPDGRGTVSSKSTYNGWLKRQSAGFQDEILGPARGKLFRQGDLSIDKFRDETGRTFTLDQLREMQPLAFQKANLD